jgi:hypothetical protein
MLAASPMIAIPIVPIDRTGDLIRQQPLLVVAHSRQPLLVVAHSRDALHQRNLAANGLA